MKYLLILALLLSVSCLPKEAGSSAAIEAIRVPPQECVVTFEKSQSLRQISETAQKYKNVCGLSEKKIMEQAKKTFN